MAINIEMSIKNSTDDYDTLYPKTLGSLIEGAVSNATNATTATNLSGNISASQVSSGTLDSARIPNLSASKITSGTLPLSRGGTGYTSWSNIASAISPYLEGLIQINRGSYVGTGNTTKISLSVGFFPDVFMVTRLSNLSWPENFFNVVRRNGSGSGTNFSYNSGEWFVSQGQYGFMWVNTNNATSVNGRMYLYAFGATKNIECYMTLTINASIVSYQGTYAGYQTYSDFGSLTKTASGEATDSQLASMMQNMNNSTYNWTAIKFG